MSRLTKEEVHKLVIDTAAKSTAKKRKVGCVLALDYCGIGYEVLAIGYNHNTMVMYGPCEDASGDTLDCVMHAEEAALTNFQGSPAYGSMPPDGPSSIIVFVSHQPCADCRAKLVAFGIKEENIIVMGDFMKFDASKLRMDLIPPSSITALAEVLTYGAKKYKPENWRKVDDVSKAYIGALMRHLNAYRDGEINDPESGLPHLAHAMTNIAFLIELDFKPERRRNGG